MLAPTRCRCAYGLKACAAHRDAAQRVLCSEAAPLFCFILHNLFTQYKAGALGRMGQID
jgi:hypothetical protein